MEAEKYFYKKDKWYHIKAIIDQDKNIFDVFVDGVKLEDLSTLQIPIPEKKKSPYPPPKTKYIKKRGYRP